MTLAPVDKELFFEVTFDSPGLPVAMSVYSLDGGMPTQVMPPTAMVNAFGNTYVGSFTPASPGGNFLIIKAVYLDGSFAAFNPGYSEGSEVIFSQDVSTGGGGSGGLGKFLEVDLSQKMIRVVVKPKAKIHVDVREC